LFKPFVQTFSTLPESNFPHVLPPSLNPSGFCEGIVDHYFTAQWDMLYLSRPHSWIGYGSRGSVIHAPLLAPYVAQKVADFFIRAFVWGFEGLAMVNTNVECQKAKMKFLCGTAFPQGEHQAHLAPTLPNLYTPQSASRAVCEDYRDACSWHFYAGATVMDLQLGKKTADNDYDDAWEAYHHCE
jgi:hypothetical protein